MVGIPGASGIGGGTSKVGFVLLLSVSVLVKLCFGKICPSNTLLKPFPLLLSMGDALSSRTLTTDTGTDFKKIYTTFRIFG
jgi:hypothetical protein